MARIPEMEARLQRWAHGVTVGDGSGFPVMSVIHPEWQPPSPGVTPTLKVSAGSDVRETHRAIAQLSARLVATLVAHYVLRPPIGQQALMLDCSTATVYLRVERAHRRLAEVLGSFCNMEKVG